MSRSPDSCTDSLPTSPAELPRRGWVLFDGDCEFCRTWVGRFEGWLARRGFECVPIQTPWAAERVGLRAGETPGEIVVLERDGRRTGGARAILRLAEHSALTRPLAWIGRRGPIFSRLDRGYRWVAARRHCLGGACRIPARKR